MRSEAFAQFIPEKVILDKAKKLPESYKELRSAVDFAERLKNWSEESEMQAAELDLYLYPAPRARPPALRPGDAEYGQGPSGACPISKDSQSMRTLHIGPWKRSDDVMDRKNARLAWMDRMYRGNRELFALDNVLKGRDIFLEPNMFPYQLPAGVVHWTLWARQEMRHTELCDYIDTWLRARIPHNVISWNYDDNRGRRTIDVWHVHIYFQGCDGQEPSIEDGKRPSDRSPCSV